VVIDEVEKMIQVLKDEEQQDIDQRDWCKETTFVKETEASRYAYKIEKTEARITKLNEKKAELEDAIVATDAEILATQEEVAAMEAKGKGGGTNSGSGSGDGGDEDHSGGGSNASGGDDDGGDD